MMVTNGRTVRTSGFLYGALGALVLAAALTLSPMRGAAPPFGLVSVLLLVGHLWTLRPAALRRDPGAPGVTVYTACRLAYSCLGIVSTCAAAVLFVLMTTKLWDIAMQMRGEVGYWMMVPLACFVGWGLYFLGVCAVLAARGVSVGDQPVTVAGDTPGVGARWTLLLTAILLILAGGMLVAFMGVFWFYWTTHGTLAMDSLVLSLPVGFVVASVLAAPLAVWGLGRHHRRLRVPVCCGIVLLIAAGGTHNWVVRNRLATGRMAPDPAITAPGIVPLVAGPQLLGSGLSVLSYRPADMADSPALIFRSWLTDPRTGATTLLGPGIPGPLSSPAPARFAMSQDMLIPIALVPGARAHPAPPHVIDLATGERHMTPAPLHAASPTLLFANRTAVWIHIRPFGAMEPHNPEASSEHTVALSPHTHIPAPPVDDENDPLMKMWDGNSAAKPDPEGYIRYARVTITVQDLASGVARTLPAYRSPQAARGDSASFFPDGRHVVVAGDIVDLETGGVIALQPGGAPLEIEFWPSSFSWFAGPDNSIQGFVVTAAPERAAVALRIHSSGTTEVIRMLPTGAAPASLDGDRVLWSEPGAEAGQRRWMLAEGPAGTPREIHRGGEEEVCYFFAGERAMLARFAPNDHTWGTVNIAERE